MATFESFGLPVDGLTRVDDVDSYSSRILLDEGWTLVGIYGPVPADKDNQKLFGVYRMTESVALVKALGDVKKANEAQSKAESAKSDAERQQKELFEKVVRLNDELTGIKLQQAGETK